MDFSEIWHGDEESDSKKSDRARFSIFDFVPDILSGKCRKWPFFEVFGDFLKNGSYDFAEILICCSPDRYATAEKIAVSGKILVRKL